MNIKHVKSLLILAFAGIALSSCKYETSGVSGWEYNNTDNGGFQKVPYFGQETGPGLVLVEGGTFTMGRVEQDVTYDWNNVPRRVTVSSFYMDEFEVTNFHWLEYLYWLRRAYESYPLVHKNALPDTLVWREKLAYNEPYVEYYLRHPAYRDYPVVGVSWLQASDFCKWRTDRVNEYILIREGVLEWQPIIQESFTTDAYLAGRDYYDVAVKNYLPNLDPRFTGSGKRGRKALGDRTVRMTDGILLPRYRLPTEAEWEFAAYGLIGNSIDERIVERRLYPWTGHWVRNPSDKWQGDMMANFVRGRGDYMGVAGALNDAGDVTTPVDSYWPNDYGLYNMAGNVSEWVMDVYRPLSSEDVDEFRPFRGNKYKTKVLNARGQIAQKHATSIYDVHGIKEWVKEFEITRAINGRLDTIAEKPLLDSINNQLDRAIDLWNAGEKIQASDVVEFDIFINLFQTQFAMGNAYPNRPNKEVEIIPFLRKGFSEFVVNTPGNLQMREVVSEENLNRDNYKIADNINYLDGDLNSSVYYNPDPNKKFSSTSGADVRARINADTSSDSEFLKPDKYEKQLMYQSAWDQGNTQKNVWKDLDSRRNADATLGQPTTLISDKSRVYKGGSWRDRAYWMVPGTRRFLDEDKSKAFIGFRCAMDRLGSPSGLGDE